MSILVVNTSPLVFLGNLGRLELLHHEGLEVYIPRSVAEEIAEKPDGVFFGSERAVWHRNRRDILPDEGSMT